MPDSGSASVIDTALALPAMSAEDAALRRRLFQVRGPVHGTLVERPATLWCLGETQGPADETHLSFEITAGAKSAILSVPSALVQQVLHAAHTGLQIDATPDDLIGMLLECALAGGLSMVEQTVGQEVAIARTATTAQGQRLALALRCAYDGTAHDCILALDRDLARDLCQLLGRIPPSKIDLPDVTVRLAIGAGFAQLPLQEVDDLAPGDVILPHSPPLAAGKGWVALADRWSAAGDLSGISLVLAERLHDTTEPIMDIDNDSSERAEVEDVELDDLPIKLVFEVGRCDMTLGAVRALGPGHVFALERDPAQSVDIIANGRRIGTGQLVRVGERLGIRVLRLGQDG